MIHLSRARQTVRACAGSALLFTLFRSAPVRAADCGCDHEIAPGTGAVNGTALGIQPGAVVCVMAGEYEFIRFREIKGTPEAPVVIKNCGGVVQVRNTDRAYAVDFQGSSHDFHLTGTGAEGVEFGFRVSAPDKDPYPGVGLWFLDKSTAYEADHVEVYETGFAGVMAKTDPLCDGSADQGVFVQKNVHLHHMWVHNTGGEGFYIGSTQSDGHTITCNGAMETHQPHFLEGIEVDHMTVEDTAWDGMQVGMAHQGCSVHDSIIRRVGTAGVQYQWQGLQIGTYSSCDVRRNILSDGPKIGVFVFGAHDTTVADNVIARFGETAVYANINMTKGPVAYRVAHNTMLDFGKAAVQVFGDPVEGAFAWNNLVVGPSASIAAGKEVGWEMAGNLFVPSVAEAGFAAPDADDFHLTGSSPARGAGVDHTADGFDVDLGGLLRAKPPSVGAYELAAASPTGGAGSEAGGPGAGAGADAGAGSDAGTGGASGEPADKPSGEGACACRAADGPKPGGPLALLSLAACASLARRRRWRGLRAHHLFAGRSLAAARDPRAGGGVQREVDADPSVQLVRLIPSLVSPHAATRSCISDPREYGAFGRVGSDT